MYKTVSKGSLSHNSKIEKLNALAGSHASNFTKELKTFITAFTRCNCYSWDVSVDEHGNLFLVPLVAADVITFYIPKLSRPVRVPVNIVGMVSTYKSLLANEKDNPEFSVRAKSLLASMNSIPDYTKTISMMLEV